jgi:DNA replication and repair protein RecF
LKITSLSLNNFRNYKQAEVRWNDKLNIICGMNAQGKSNLLEAICYLSLSNSFRGATDSDILAYGADFFRLSGQIENREIKSELVVAYSKGRKIWKIDGQNKRKVSEIVGCFYTIIFSPEDLSLVKSGPDTRRKFFNRQMAQLYPDFYVLLLRYNKTLKQRNSLLRMEKITDEELLPWEDQLAQLSAQIVKRRIEMLKLLTPNIAKVHNTLNKDEILTIEYKGILPEKQLEKLSLSELKKVYLANYFRLKRAERARMMTLSGPHRDDFIIKINQMPAKNFASQGQQRSAALALKLGEMELAYTERGYYPVLLLDDVMSEFDILRREQLLTMINGKSQTFITATDLNFQLFDGQKFVIEKGIIKQ